MRTRHARSRIIHLGVRLVLTALLLPVPAAAQTAQPPDDVRDVIEGTWRLIEWHVGDRVLEPPEMEGMWMVFDGWVMATRHREGADGYESTAGYGPYTWGPSTWTYGYERSEDRRGPSADEAPLRVTEIPLRTFEIVRERDHLILEDADQTLRWDYDIPGGTFTLMGRNRRVIRVYERITP